MHQGFRAACATAAAIAAATAGLALPATAHAATPVCADGVWKATYYPNTSFSGPPKLTACDTSINEDYGTGDPAGVTLPRDNFTVRWQTTRNFGSGGPFSFSTAVRDGVRVYVDGVRKVDIWKNVSTTQTKTVNLTIPSGRHTIRVDFVAWTGYANVKFGYAARTSATVDTVKPLAPAGVSAAYAPATLKATIRWAKSPEMDLAGYHLYRRLAGTSAWTRQTSTPLTATSCTNTPPATGAVYQYVVRAVDKAGNESGGSATQSVTTTDRTAPAAPTGAAAASEMDGMRIRWSGVAGAVSYRVYRAASADGAFAEVGSTNQVSYLDTSADEGVTSYYRVTALDAAGNESARSSTVSGTRGDLTPPSAVTGLALTPTEYGFALRWDANPTPDLGRYVVYAGELLGDEEEKVCSVHEVEWLSADTTSYAYATIPDGDERCVFIDAVDDDWNSHYKWTRSPEIVVATELDTTPSVATPEGSPLSVDVWSAEGDEGNQVTWYGLGEDSPEAAGGYRVHRWNPATGAYEKIADLDRYGFEYFDTNGKRGTTSYYWVTAVGADGTESLPAGGRAVTAPAQ
ncbi:fibronectin type III domain-containing protein [Streptomyces sp. NPDC002889]|uniref:fibronectin type III domain-containing protein n=1 Tax=Streptomyces sp. NPDC002889 TaxID=3364669 RepID=UPI0036BA3916